MSDQGVAAVDRAISILNAFLVKGRNSMSLSEIAEETGLYKSTILRLCASLIKGGLLNRSADGSFQLGPQCLSLGGRYQQGFSLGSVVVPELEALADATGESASFYVREGARRVCLFRANATQHRITHVLPVGTSYDVHTGSAGQALTAFGPERPDELAPVRERMYAVSLNQRTLSETGAVASPVFGANGALVGSIGVTGPINRFHEEAVRSFASDLLEVAGRLSDALGGDGSDHVRARHALLAAASTS